MSWRLAEPLGHSVPWLMGERGLPSMSTSSPPRVYTSCPQPTAQYGHTDSVTFSPAMREPARSVSAEAADSPVPQSIARPRTGRRRSASKDLGRDAGRATTRARYPPGAVLNLGVCRARPPGTPPAIGQGRAPGEEGQRMAFKSPPEITQAGIEV